MASTTVKLILGFVGFYDLSCLYSFLDTISSISRWRKCSVLKTPVGKALGTKLIPKQDLPISIAVKQHLKLSLSVVIGRFSSFPPLEPCLSFIPI